MPVCPVSGQMFLLVTPVKAVCPPVQPQLCFVISEHIVNPTHTDSALYSLCTDMHGRSNIRVKQMPSSLPLITLCKICALHDRTLEVELSQHLLHQMQQSHQLVVSCCQMANSILSHLLERRASLMLQWMSGAISSTVQVQMQQQAREQLTGTTA